MIKGCILPWIHMFGNLAGTYKLCCHTDNFKVNAPIDPNYRGPVKGQATDSPLNIWNNESFRETRLKMLKGEYPAECQHVCLNIEKNGLSSHRTKVNQKYERYAWLQDKTNSDGSVKNPPIYLDFRFGNTCNFKCRMCSPEISTSWWKEKHLSAYSLPIDYKGKPSIDPWTNNTKFWEDMEKIAKYVRVVYFAGGEPMVQDGHYKMLEFLIKHKNTNVELQYNSNLSYKKFKNYDLDKLWSQFSKVKLWPSVDGYGKSVEYSRKGFSWDTFSENVNLFRKYIEVFSITANVYSIYSNVELIKWIKRQNLSFHITSLIDPPYLQTTILPKNLKEIITKKYKDLLENNYSSLLDHEVKCTIDSLRHMNSTDDSNFIPKFKKWNEKLDESRNEKFIEIFPEHAEWYQTT